jgi:SAM-dependent methyltransferase
LDFGSGTAQNTFMLKSNSKVVKFTAVDEAYKSDFSPTWKEKNMNFSNVVPAEQFDLILLMDVLEHIENDQETFQKLFLHNLKPGGIVLITVPAFDFLWSKHDEILQHKRRYNLKEISKCIETKDSQILYLKYAFSFVAPFLYLFRKFENFFGHSKKSPSLPKVNGFINHLFYKISQLEMYLNGSNWLGTSVVCIVKKT